MGAPSSVCDWFGEHDEDQMMSDSNPSFEVLRAINDILRENRKNPEVGYEKLMAYVSPLLERGDAPSRAFLLQRTIDALGLLGRVDEAGRMVEELVGLDGGSVENWVCASTFYRLYRKDHMKAIEAAESAVAAALRTGNSVIYSYEELCRAAKDASNYELFKQSLERALDYKGGEFNRDIRLANDLLDDVPLGAVDAQLAERYRSIASHS